MTDASTKIECLTEGELLNPVTEQDLLEQAGGLMDKAYVYDILGDVIYLTEDGRWKVATIETSLAEANPPYLKARLEEWLAEAEADHPLYERAQEKLAQLTKAEKSIYVALHGADTIEVDGIYAGRNWVFTDEADEKWLEVEHVDDNDLSKFEWFFEQEALDRATYHDGYWWADDNSGYAIRIRLFGLQELGG